MLGSFEGNFAPFLVINCPKLGGGFHCQLGGLLLVLILIIGSLLLTTTVEGEFPRQWLNRSCYISGPFFFREPNLSLQGIAINRGVVQRGQNPAQVRKRAIFSGFLTAVVELNRTGKGGKIIKYYSLKLRLLM